MEPREIQNYDDEVTIDLAHLVISILKKWKVLLVMAVIGALLGGLWHWRSVEEAKGAAAPVEVTAEMEVAAVYRRQYETLLAYTETSPFMKLNSEAVAIGEGSYFLAVNENEEQIAASLASILRDEAVRASLCSILEIEDELDLDKMVYLDKTVSLESQKNGDSSTTIAEGMGLMNTDRRSLCFTVYAQSKEQAGQALEVLHDAVMALEKETELRVAQTTQNVRIGNAKSIRNDQNTLVEKMNSAFKNCTALESKFTEEQKALYGVYAKTGDISGYSAAAAVPSPLKKPLIAAVSAVLLACVWYAAAYLLSAEVKNADDVTHITGKRILAFLNEAAPQRNVIDRWLDNLEAGRFPTPVHTSYAVTAVAKLGQAVVVYDETNEDLKKLAGELAGVTCVGLIGQDSQTLNRLNRDTNVVFLVKLDISTKSQLQREVSMCHQYGIPVAGSILVK